MSAPASGGVRKPKHYRPGTIEVVSEEIPVAEVVDDIVVAEIVRDITGVINDITGVINDIKEC